MNSRNQAARTATPEATPLRNLMGEIDPANDAFVRQVMEAFGATVVRITSAPAVQIVATDSEDDE